MSTLHTIAKSPTSNLLESCRQLLGQNENLLFIEDGVYYASREDLLATIPGKRKLYALREDILARGIQGKITDRIELVSMHKFVELCCEHKKIINWF